MKALSISGIGILLVVAAAALGMIALAGQTGAALSDTVAEMELPVAGDIPDDLDDDIAMITGTQTEASANYAMSHGMVHDGAAAIRNCLQQSGPLMTWEKPGQNRRIHVCVINNRVGFQVEVKENGVWKAITEYFKDRFQGDKLQAVRDYFNRNGARLIYSK